MNKEQYFPQDQALLFLLGALGAFCCVLFSSKEWGSKRKPRFKQLDSPVNKKISGYTLNNDLPSSGRGLATLFLLVHHVIPDFSSSLLGTKDGLLAPHLSISLQMNSFCIIPRYDLQCAKKFWLFTPPLNSKIKGIKPFQGEVLT